MSITRQLKFLSTYTKNGKKNAMQNMLNYLDLMNVKQQVRNVRKLLLFNLSFDFHMVANTN